jgi:hypothetical protein
MGCPFQAGDEVEKFRRGLPYPRPRDNGASVILPVGFRGVVREVVWHEAWGPDVFGLLFVGIPGDICCSYYAGNFRKVERRNDRLSIEAFMTMPGGFEEPRRPKAPAKKRERAQ